MYRYADHEFALDEPSWGVVLISHGDRSLRVEASSTESNNGSHPVTVLRIKDQTGDLTERRSFKEALHWSCEHLLAQPRTSQ